VTCSPSLMFQRRQQLGQRSHLGICHLELRGLRRHSPDPTDLHACRRRRVRLGSPGKQMIRHSTSIAVACSFAQALAFALAPIAAMGADTLNRCVDPDGAVMWSSEPCPIGQQTTRRLPVEVSREARAAEPAYVDSPRVPEHRNALGVQAAKPTACDLARARCESAKKKRDEWFRNRSANAGGANSMRYWNDWVRKECTEFGPQC
jgi:hypothetical protein